MAIYFCSGSYMDLSRKRIIFVTSTSCVFLLEQSSYLFCCTPLLPLTLGGAPPLHPLCTPFAPPTTGAAPLGFGGAPLLHPPAPSQVLDFGILPMYLSFQVHLWSSYSQFSSNFCRGRTCPKALLLQRKPS